MPTNLEPTVRPFRRADRDQVTGLVNAHAAAVLPGAGASVNAVMTQLEREPGEQIVDPWVAERRALVAEQAGAVVAAALMLRYRNDPDVGAMYRVAGEIRWLVFRPLAPSGNPYWHDGREAGELLMSACLEQLRDWRVRTAYADGALPIAGVYGTPAQWPHIADLYAAQGFRLPEEHHTEVLHLLDLATSVVAAEPPLAGLSLQRTVGINGVRFAAVLGESVGYIEVETLEPAERMVRRGGLADIGNLWVQEPYRRRGVGSWLLGAAVDWLRLAQVDRLLHYATPDETAAIAFVERHGFVELTRTRRGWQRDL